MLSFCDLKGVHRGRGIQSSVFQGNSLHPFVVLAVVYSESPAAMVFEAVARGITGTASIAT